MDQFLERHKLSKPTQGKIVWIGISIKEGSTRFRWFHLWTLPHIQGRNDTALYNLFQKMQAERAFPNSFYEASITLMPKQEKTLQERTRKTIIFHVHKCKNKNPQQNISKSNPTMYKKNYIAWASRIYSRFVRLIQHSKINPFNPSHQ